MDKCNSSPVGHLQFLPQPQGICSYISNFLLLRPPCASRQSCGKDLGWPHFRSLFWWPPSGPWETLTHSLPKHNVGMRADPWRHLPSALPSEQPDFYISQGNQTIIHCVLKVPGTDSYSHSHVEAIGNILDSSFHNSSSSQPVFQPLRFFFSFEG